MSDVVTALGIEGATGQIRVVGVVDTGARTSVIPRGLLSMVGAAWLPDSIEVAVAFNGRSSRELAAVTLRLLQHGERPHELNVIVGEPEEEPLVGMDLLEREGLWIDTEKSQLVPKPDAAPILPPKAVPLPGGGYTLNMPKGYETRLSRARFEAASAGKPQAERSGSPRSIPTRPTGFKTKP